MYKILIKHNPNANKSDTTIWRMHGSTTTSTTSTSFKEFETDDIEVLKEEVKKIASKIGYDEIRIVSDIVFDIEIGIENNRESGEQS